MNTSRDVKRAMQQMIKQSGIDGDGDSDGGEAVFPGKLKRERMRKLSVVGRVISSNEDGGGSGSEDELRSITRISKRFKLPRKFFCDRKTVDHASVPRKLRSAMKKRNQGSISPPLPVKKPRKDGIKKSTWNEQQGDLEDSPSRSMVGPITKDEEEVVQTLFALAEMFPNNNGKNGSDGEFAKAKSWSLPEGESSRPASEAPEKEENSKSLCPSNIVEAVNPSVLEGSALLTVDAKRSNEQSVPNSIHLHTELDDGISKRNFQAMPLCSHCKPINGKPSCHSVGCNVQSEMSPGNGSKRPKHEEAAACERKPEMEAATVSSQHQSQYILMESKKSGSTLWPGLSSAESHGAGAQGPSLHTMIPALLGMAAAAAPLGNVALTEKDSRGPVARMKSWKRSSAHVYICRLIKVLQFAEKTDRSSTPPAQLTPNEGSKQRVLSTANNVNGDRNGFNGAVSYHNIVGSASERTPNEVRNGIPLHKRLLHDQQQASTSSALYTSLKQDFDFMSLSAGSGGIESSNGTDKAGNELEPLMQFHIPYPQSHAQNHTIMPFSLPENCFSSTPFTYRLPVAAAKQVHIQPPAHMGSPLSVPPHLGTSSTPKQQQQQQQQQQRWIWTALPGQYKPQIPNWQNGRQVSSSSATQYAQSIPPPSYSSLEVLGPRYVPISQQQQELIRRQQHHHLPSGYEGNGVGSYPDAARPLQLLCNEHL